MFSKTAVGIVGKVGLETSSDVTAITNRLLVHFPEYSSPLFPAVKTLPGAEIVTTSSSFAAIANDIDDAVVTRPLSFSKEGEDSNDVVVEEPVTTRLSSWFSGEDDNRWRFDACPSSGWAA